MRYRLLGATVLCCLAQNSMAAKPVIAAQPSSCIISDFTSSGNPYWSNITLKLTNNCKTTVDFENTIVTFKNKKALNTQFWGSFGSLPYPESPLNIISQPQSDGTYLATLTMHFSASYGQSTQLKAGKSIRIQYGTPADTHINNTTNIYVGETPVETGSLQIQNASAQPNNVTSGYSLVHLTVNGTQVSDIQLPWSSTTNVPNLMPGTYAISAEDVIDNFGNIYRGTAVPSSVNVTAHQQSFTTTTYAQVQQSGQINLIIPALPTELVGYAKTVTVSYRETQSGSTGTQNLNWDTTSTVNQLKSGSAYTVSTDVINYNGYSCTGTFNPGTVIANKTPDTTNLSYQCVKVAQDMVTLVVSGAPSSLNSLKVLLTPNNNSAAITSSINLNDGSGSQTVLLVNGVIYTLSSDAVAGYSIKFIPQLLTATSNTTASILLTKQNTGTPVAINGQLTVCGTQLCNEQGDAIQLKGMSTHGLQWYGQGVCITSASVDTLTNDFKANVIRLSMYVQEGGYETNPSQFTQQVNSLIEEASRRGIYVIVDWHILTPGDPNYNLDLAKKFFTDIATTNKNRNNLLYEIANEPNGVSWATIKSYANQIIPVIRAIDSKAPILVGTRAWSSLGLSEGANYQEIVHHPLTFSNIMYTFHFYAASHKHEYFNALDQASQVLPIFVTEFGTQTYSGDGPNDFFMSDRYMQLMATKKIGWTNWNYSDDSLSGAIWKPGTCAKNVWTESNLKPAGVYIKNKILNS